MNKIWSVLHRGAKSHSQSLLILEGAISYWYDRWQNVKSLYSIYWGTNKELVSANNNKFGWLLSLYKRTKNKLAIERVKHVLFFPSPSSHSLQRRNLVGLSVFKVCSKFGVTGSFYTQFPTTAGVELSGLLVKGGGFEQDFLVIVCFCNQTQKIWTNLKMIQLFFMIQFYVTF